MIVNIIGGISLFLAGLSFITMFIRVSGDEEANRDLAKVMALFLIAAAMCFK